MSLRSIAGGDHFGDRGVLIPAAITAAGMHYAVAWSWATAPVFGVLISATDPVSVIATFNEALVGGDVDFVWIELSGPRLRLSSLLTDL